MDKSYKYIFGVNSLNRARNLQSQVSQIDLDISLKQLSHQSSFNETNDTASLYYMQRVKDNLILERDALISTAIVAASEILMDEIEHKVAGYLSLGRIMIDSILSFMSIYNIKVRISVLARTQLIQLSLKLLLPDMPYMDLPAKIERLDKLLY